MEIAIDVPCYRLTVSDNGSGIPQQKLDSLVATERGEETQSACRHSCCQKSWHLLLVAVPRMLYLALSCFV